MVSVSYWLFSASLIIFSNGFCKVYVDIDNIHAMQTALNLHRYLGETDPLAARYLQILTAFNEAITVDSIYRAPPSSSSAVNKTQDLFATFFGGDSNRSTGSGSESRIDSAMTASDPIGASSAALNTQSSPTFQANASHSTPYPQPSNIPSATPTSTHIPQEPFPRSHPDSANTVDRISPPDYSLDFDAFLAAVGGTADQGDAEYQQDLYMPLYSTINFASETMGFKQ